MSKYFKILLLVAISLILSNSACTKKEPPFITVCSFGGSFQESQRKAFFEPFEKETGIKVKEASYSGEISIIEGMVRTQNVEWDVVDVEHASFIIGIKKALFEPIDLSLIDTTELVPGTFHKYGLGADIYSTVLAYNSTTFERKNKPKNWSDFWNVSKFPGPRALRNNPYGTLEIAILATGEKNLYPINLNKAFASLDKIKKNINVWWTQGQQPVQLLTDKEVVMSSAWSGRIFNAKHIKNLPLEMSYENALLEPEWWVIVKGTKKYELAMKFIAFCMRPENQAKMSLLFGVGPTNKKAIELLPDSIKADLPTYPENLKKQIMINAEFWSQNFDKIIEKWNTWITK